MMARHHSPAFSLLSDFDRVSESAEVPDHEAQLKAAFDEGYRQGHADGRAEAEADAELLLAEASTRHANDLADERSTWQRECADVLISRLQGAEKSLGHDIEERVATLLRPWLIDRLRDQALLDLERAISRALVDGTNVHIEAPSGIIQHLRDRLPSQTFQIGYSETPDSDVRVHIEDTKIEVNISAWIAELEAAVP